MVITRPLLNFKYSFLTWLTTRNRLTTWNRMIKWQAGVDISCVFCSEHIEDREYLFFTCGYANEIWSGLSKKVMGHKFSTRWNDIQTVLIDMSLGMHCLFLTRYNFQFYSIWRERNSPRHREESIPAHVASKSGQTGSESHLFYTGAGR